MADHTRDDSMAAIARRILAAAPQHFALVGHSMGGYIAFEILRQAADRVIRQQTAMMRRQDWLGRA